MARTIHHSTLKAVGKLLALQHRTPSIPSLCCAHEARASKRAAVLKCDGENEAIAIVWICNNGVLAGRVVSQHSYLPAADRLQSRPARCESKAATSGVPLGKLPKPVAQGRRLTLEGLVSHAEAAGTIPAWSSKQAVDEHLNKAGQIHAGAPVPARARPSVPPAHLNSVPHKSGGTWPCTTSMKYPSGSSSASINPRSHASRKGLYWTSTAVLRACPSAAGLGVVPVAFSVLAAVPAPECSRRSSKEEAAAVLLLLPLPLVLLPPLVLVALPLRRRSSWAASSCNICCCCCCCKD